ncbi:MAG: T9SS type A sorting domain-containing protein [Bacteroidia bacterium]|nr:T9SS type A sorting domain-containing protein [Bacteroidia bacterium]
MKKLLLTLTLAGTAFAGIDAQTSSYTIKDGAGNIINGQTITLTDEPSTPLITFDFDVTNNGNLPKTTYMERQELVLIPSTQNYFCWDVCYPPFVSTSTNGVSITNGGTYTLGTVDYQPQGQLGMSVIRYVIYDFQNPNDSAWFIINWNITPASVEEEMSGSILPAFPNPALTHTTINYELQGRNGYLNICNMLGEIVKVIPVSSGKNSVTLDVTELKSGIYFYSLVAEHKILATRKFTVSR